MKNIKSNFWFTLIEILVAITILSLIMVAVIVTFITSSRVNNTVDSSRELQRNIKTAVEAIAEDVRKYWIEAIDDHLSVTTEWSFKSGHILVIKTNDGILKEYYLWEFDGTNWVAKTNDQCIADTNLECRLILKETVGSDPSTIAPLTNGRVQFEDLTFYGDLSDPTSLTKKYKDRVQVNFTIKPSYKHGLPKDFADSATMKFQTTLSERIIDKVTQ